MAAARIRLLSVAFPVALAVSACGGGGGGGETASPPGPYDGTPPLGLAIAPTEGIDTGAPGWKWIPFGDAFCTDLDLRKSTTGLAINWGTSSDLVVFLAGGGAYWDYLTCAFGAASTGPFGAAEFKADVYDQDPSSWVHRDKLPAAIAGATR